MTIINNKYLYTKLYLFITLQVLYTGKSQGLGIKQGGPLPGKWAELPITKSPKITSFAVGHDGQHALLVAEDGSVFFVGTPKRGEDGDGSLCECVTEIYDTWIY